MPLRCNGGVHAQLHAFLTSALDEPVSGQHHAPTALLLTKDSPVPIYWLGPRICLDILENRHKIWH